MSSPSPWSPLARPVFRLVSVASLASQVGTWINEVAAAWLMTSLAPSPIIVALGQTTATAPLFALALLAVQVAHGAPPPNPPPFEKLRYEEDYRYLRNPAASSSWLDPIKHIELSGLSDSHVSLGGEIRWRYDNRQNPAWGDAPEDEDGAFLQRYLVHADLHVGAHLRAFVQLRSALEHGREEASPVEDGPLDLQQVFVEAAAGFGDATLQARVGRQELLLGSERLVSVREGTTIRRRFDLVRADLFWHDVRLTALAGYLAENQDAVFEDGTDEDQVLWGVYTVWNRVPWLPGSLDLYYLGYRNREAAYEQGTARELRHTLGVRLFGEQSGFDWNAEGFYQLGDFGSGSISAWSAALEGGYTFAHLPWAPRLGLNTNVASGDRDPADRDLETFNAIYPRGNYFSHLALLGPRNFFNVHPGLSLSPHPDLALGLDVNLFWRLSTDDGIYGPSGRLLRASGGSDERFVGTAVSASLDWQLDRSLFLGVVYTHAFPGEFIDETGPDRTIRFVEVTLRFQF